MFNGFKFVLIGFEGGTFSDFYFVIQAAEQIKKTMPCPKVNGKRQGAVLFQNERFKGRGL